MQFYIIQSKSLNQIELKLNRSSKHINDYYCLLDQRMIDEKAPCYSTTPYSYKHIPFPIGTLMKCQFFGYVMNLCKADNTSSSAEKNWSFGPDHTKNGMQQSDFQDYVIKKCQDYRKDNPNELLPKVSVKFIDRLKLAANVLFKPNFYQA